MANIRPSGSVASWKPKMPSTELEDAPLLQATMAKDDPDCIPGKDSPYEPFARGAMRPAAPFGLGVPGNKET